jgi:hypothetical protein
MPIPATAFGTIHSIEKLRHSRRYAVVPFWQSLASHLTLYLKGVFDYPES